MKSLNKLFVKMFSVVLSLMLLNLPVFADRFAIITESASYIGETLVVLENYQNGVFFVTGTNKLTLTVENYSFQNNHNYGNGGVLINDNSNALAKISAKFISNDSVLGGGAIYNKGDITLGNYTTFDKNSTTVNGGAIESVAGEVTVRYKSVFSSNQSLQGNGGAIDNSGSSVLNIGSRINFNKNSALNGNGGAISTVGGKCIVDSSVSFSSNTAKLGGAIYNGGESLLKIGKNASFNENSATENGGAIYNEAHDNEAHDKLVYIDDESTFTSNKAKKGGAIYNYSGSVGVGNAVEFSKNEATNGSGGAVYNGGTSFFETWYQSKFNENSANWYGGAIALYDSASLRVGASVSFSSNTANQGGGAIYSASSGDIDIYSGTTFSYNSAPFGGAILYMPNSSSAGSFTIGDRVSFNGNSADTGGAIMNNGELITIGKEVIFTDNTSSAGKGGAIYNNTGGIITFTDGAIFKNNTGGAIYNNRGTLNFVADTSNVEFTGNKLNGQSSAINNASSGSMSIINLWASKNADIIFNDRITGSGELNINKKFSTNPTSGKIVLNEDMSGFLGTVMFYNGTIELGENGKWFGREMEVFNSPTIDMVNSIVAAINFNDLTVNDTLKLVVDADLANEEMDTISAGTFKKNSGKIKVTGINILSDIEENEKVEIAFANDVLKNSVSSVNKASSELYTYRVKYDKETGNFSFTNTGDAEDAEINLGTAASAIAASVGGYATQSAVVNQVFANIDTKVSNKNIKSVNMNPSNLYVSAGDQVFDNGGKIERGLWLKPFVAQETVKIGDADVDNNLYGTLAGIDFPAGQDKQLSFYLGYAGSKQEIEDVKSNQTGYVLGATGMIIKDSWYAGLTANVMFNKASINTDFGTDDVDMNMFSVGAKAGYNYEINEKWGLEPNITLMYGVVNSQEYETSQGAKIDSQSINNILVEPQIKAKLSLSNGWQPYGLLGYSANLSSKPTVKTEGVELELDSIDGYVEYGAGVNKDFIGTVWSCYAQVTGKSGGRNGFAGNLGIKYKF